MIQNVLERRVGNKAAVPVMFAIDFDRRQSGWKRARRHDMIDGDPPLTAVEIDEIASADIDSAGAVSDRPFVQQVEVDEARQRLAQRPGIIKAERRSEEHTSELQSLMRISYAVFCLKKTTNKKKITQH